MLIDADCHISSHRFDGLAMTGDDLVAEMDRSGVDRAIVWLKPRYDKEIEAENRAIYEAAQKYPDRLIPFGWTNPRLGNERASAAIKASFEEYGFYGIKFNGAQDDYVIDDDAVMPLIEQAAAYGGKMLAFHIGADFYENTHPYRLGRIAERLPETQFFLIHIGGAGKPDLSRAALEVTAAQPNITLIGSAIPFRVVQRSIAQVGADRVCFGSDTPFELMGSCLAAYRALMRDTPEADQAKVLGGNVQRLLNL